MNESIDTAESRKGRQHFYFREFWTMFRYGLVGFANTGVFALAAWLLEKTGWHYTAYTALAYAIAILFSFTMNTLFTFRKSANPLLPMFTKFIITTLSLLGLVQLIQLALIEKAGWQELPGIIAGMLFYTGVGYIINRVWVFRIAGSKDSNSGESV